MIDCTAVKVCELANHAGLQSRESFSMPIQCVGVLINVILRIIAAVLA